MTKLVGNRLLHLDHKSLACRGISSDSTARLDGPLLRQKLGKSLLSPLRSFFLERQTPSKGPDCCYQNRCAREFSTQAVRRSETRLFSQKTVCNCSKGHRLAMVVRPSINVNVQIGQKSKEKDPSQAEMKLIEEKMKMRASKGQEGAEGTTEMASCELKVDVVCSTRRRSAA